MEFLIDLLYFQMNMVLKNILSVDWLSNRIQKGFGLLCILLNTSGCFTHKLSIVMSDMMGIVSFGNSSQFLPIIASVPIVTHAALVVFSFALLV